MEYIEQPIDYKDLDGMYYIRNASEIPVMSDESMHSPEDALELANTAPTNG